MSNVAVLPPPTSRPLARASEHLAAGRLAEAAGAFKAVLQIDPHESQAHFGLAQCAVGRGQHDVAYEHFLRTAQLLRERGASDDALTCYGYAVSSDPRRIDIHVDIAELEMELGRREAALARLDGLAEAYLAADREDDAVAILEFMNELQAGDDDEPEPTASAPQMFEPGAFEAGAIPEPVRDVEGTMMISTFLLTPDGTPFVPGAPPPLMVGEPRSASRITEVPTAAPRATVVPTTAPRATVVPTAPPRATVVPTAAPRATVVPTMGTPAPVVDDPSASEPIRAHAEALDATATRRSSNPLPAIVSAVLDEDSSELAMLAVADLDALDVGDLEDPEIDATAVRAKPLPKAAPTPSSVDAQGRSLAERLRTTRARAATAPQPIVGAPSRSPEPAPAVRVAPPIGAGTTVNRAATAASKPAASPPTRTSAPSSASKPISASKPASASRPSAASPGASKPAASTPVRASTAGPRPSTPAKAAVSTRAVPAASRPTSAPRPGATTRPATSNGARPGASAPTPSRPSPQAASASKPAVARPSAAPRSPTNGAARAPTPATSSRPAASTRAAAPTGGPTRASVPTRASTAAGRTAGAQRPASATASEPQPRGDANTRVMAVRTRAPAPAAGVPTAVGPSRTLPMVIPPPPREEFDDQNTVIFRGEG
jgi:tetratricopeptide (TPR) repeat protein